MTLTMRTITKGEADSFLALLCESFHLDQNRAKAIFFSEPLFDLSRKWALFVGDEMTSILTTSPLRFGHAEAFGIAGVATRPTERGKGYGTSLVSHVVQSTGLPALLFAHDNRLYESAGFEVVDQVIKGKITPLEESEDRPLQELLFEEVRTIYDDWAASDRCRLIRDDQRWRYWQWVTRTCEPFERGYLCLEPALCREAIVNSSSPQWPVSRGTDWYGLETMMNALQVPMEKSTRDLFLMANGLDFQPQMFMTDQF